MQETEEGPATSEQDKGIWPQGYWLLEAEGVVLLVSIMEVMEGKPMLVMAVPILLEALATVQVKPGVDPAATTLSETVTTDTLDSEVLELSLCQAVVGADITVVVEGDIIALGGVDLATITPPNVR